MRAFVILSTGTSALHHLQAPVGMLRCSQLRQFSIKINHPPSPPLHATALLRRHHLHVGVPGPLRDPDSLVLLLQLLHLARPQLHLITLS